MSSLVGSPQWSEAWCPRPPDGLTPLLNPALSRVKKLLFLCCVCTLSYNIYFGTHLLLLFVIFKVNDGFELRWLEGD